MLRIIRTCFGPNSPPPHQMIPSVKGVPLYSLDAPTSEQTIVDPQPRQQPLSEDVSATILLTSSSVEVPVEEVVLEYLHKNILVLGFYDRDNTGDELFKDAFRFLLGDTASLTFACTDDVTVVPEGTDVVIVGGGDVINDYFMAKVTSILDASPVFKGEVYALSVGIPYASCADKWLHIFDHVFARNSEDYALAKTVLGDHNVTQMCDACAYIPSVGAEPRTSSSLTRIGIAVSRPFLLAHPDALVEIARAFARLEHEFPSLFEIHMIAFNHHEANADECDHISCDDLYDALLLRRVDNVFFHDEAKDRTPLSSIGLVRSMDVVVCMRYHSAVFALTSPDVQPIVMECSVKLSKLAKDYKATTVDVSARQGLSSRLFFAMRDKMRTPNALQMRIEADDAAKFIKTMILQDPRKRNELALLPDLFDLKSSDDCDRELQKRMKTVARLLPGGTRLDPMRDARLLSMILTDTVSHACVWGLYQNMTKPDFELVEAAKYVWGDRVEKANASKASLLASSTVYLPGGGWGPATKRTYVDLRCHSLLAASYHRSGWTYVESGMQSLSAKRFGRASGVIVDTYADETFLWACDANVRTGVLPYRSRWIAFVHHTFHAANYPHDLKSMFAEKAFIDSLPSCACLVALTRTLSDQIRDALDALPGGVGKKVRVATLTHPTELGSLPEFSIDAFLASTPSKPRRLLQVGAWLRDEASFRTFPLGTNPLGLTKAVLRTHAVDKNKKNDKDQDKDNDAPSGFASGFASGFSSGFASGFVVNQDGQVRECDDVEEIGYLSASEYDALLTLSVVFLCLFDASAVNTVIECIVRKTPIIVNRLPAVEEALGSDYPGFYEKGSAIEIDEALIRRCYEHLKNVDTTPYRLDTFLTQLDSLVHSL